MTLVQRDPALHERLTRLGREARMVVVAGLPGTGKSLVIHQLAHLAAATERSVHVLQWDVARPVFEDSAAGRRYPVVDGVTHPMIRAAVGLWARGAIAAWPERHRSTADLLVVEAPLVGRRLIELAWPAGDEAERYLDAAWCRFVVAVPSAEVRRHVEVQRERRAACARHPREREDAPPHVLRELWGQVVTAAHALGIATARDVPYDPLAYRRVYETVLRHRRPELLELHTILPTETMSVYDFALPITDVRPGLAETEPVIRAAERLYPDRDALARAAERWWEA